MSNGSSDLLTVDETAAILKRSPAALRYMIHAGTAPRSATIGRRRVFRRADVEAFIAAAFAETAVEV